MISTKALFLQSNRHKSRFVWPPIFKEMVVGAIRFPTREATFIHHQRTKYF